MQSRLPQGRVKRQVYLIVRQAQGFLGERALFGGRCELCKLLRRF